MCEPHQGVEQFAPPTIRVKRVEDVPPSFHARFDVRCKTYRYRILTTEVCSPLLCRFVYHHPYPLNFERMAQAATLWEGEHDFTSFTAADTQDDGENVSNVRTVLRSRLRWLPRSSMLAYEVTAKGFLRYMVRNFVGTLIEVGRSRLEPEDIPTILEARDRSQAGPTAPAQGLCLMRVEY